MARNPDGTTAAVPDTDRGREPVPIAIDRVYEALRAIARRERGRNPSRTLNTTVLIHEAWLKLGEDQQWSSERHCLASYAMAIRQVLIDYIRNRCAAKRTPDPGFERFQIEQLGERSAEDLLEIDRALDDLEALEPRLARLVELRFFAGLSLREVAEQLTVSERTATRDWQRARAFPQINRHGPD
ncbi:MAG: ECF-type sigma factor [Pseudomonadota bacterium]